MTYLDIARSLEYATKETEDVETGRVDRRDEQAPGYERNECDEKSPALLTAQDAERLRAQIIATVDVEPAEFDRETYDRLMTRWTVHEAAGSAVRRGT